MFRQIGGMNSRVRFLAPVLACAVLVAGPAHAASTLAFLPAAILFGAQPAPPAGCETQPASLVPAPVPPPAAITSKAAALLGGAPSALERMREQQVSGAMPAMAGACPTHAVPMETTALAIAPVTSPAPALAPNPAPPLPGEFLASRRLAIAHTAFDAQWNRVSHATLDEGMVRRMGVAASGQPVAARLQAVNAWANAHIRYAEDRTLFGTADYWANAGETLRRGAGDCEDIAILKLQLLAAMGLPRDAMFLTIARDLVRHADHALLIVRDGERFWMLDNATDRLIDAGPSADYRPVFSFGQNGKWLHGYASQIAAAPVALPVPAERGVTLSAGLIDAPALRAPLLDPQMFDTPSLDAPVAEPRRLAFNAR